MKPFYNSEKAIQVVVSLLKQYGIKKIIASPGGTNVTFVATIQQDDFFEIYSCVDERSAAYIACGLTAESGEPVAISCTGATSSRNYMPGLTEAYYRKLPIVAITSTRDLQQQGNLMAQNVDRSILPNDISVCSVHIPYIRNNADLGYSIVQVNKALHKLTRHGGGPVHINLTTYFSDQYIDGLVPTFKKINYFFVNDKLPDLPTGKIGIFIGSHKLFTEEEISLIDSFCQENNAIVFHDHTSGYKGDFGINYSLIAAQDKYAATFGLMDLLIHLGEVSGDYYSLHKIRGRYVWRIGSDGEPRNTFGNLSAVFEMNERDFFSYYSGKQKVSNTENYDVLQKFDKEMRKNIPELPFSNIYCAFKLHDKLPDGSLIYFGILNSLRSWNFFPLRKDIRSFCNVGGFGIDGGVSSLIGSSLASPNKICFGVFGDLGFFYDMNVVGNRHVGNNVRILLVNNGHGQEFRNTTTGAGFMGDETDKYIAAGGHYGHKSEFLIKHFAQDLGFEYLSASTKQEFDDVYMHFVTEEVLDRPIIFEVFTNTKDESDALHLMHTLYIDRTFSFKSAIDGVVKDLRKKVTNKAKEHFGQY